MEVLDSQFVNLLQYPVKQRNQLVDAIFYDVEALTDKDRAKLSPLVDREGTIVVVPPRNSSGEIRHYKNSLRFLVGEGNTVKAIVVAGVGSSVLGTAALARNVADHYGVDVAGVVSGYGVSDVMSEALGGWYFYGTIDRFWNEMEILTESFTTRPTESPIANQPERKGLWGSPIDSRFVLPGSSDIGTLYDVLMVSRDLRLLVGHSKGNLIISLALRHFAQELGEEHHPHYDNLTVVTLGAVVTLRHEFKRQRQFLGQLDGLGAINSEPTLPHEVVSDAGHHLNTQLPMHMSVSKVLDTVALAT